MRLNLVNSSAKMGITNDLGWLSTILTISLKVRSTFPSDSLLKRLFSDFLACCF